MQASGLSEIRQSNPNSHQPVYRPSRNISVSPVEHRGERDAQNVLGLQDSVRRGAAGNQQCHGGRYRHSDCLEKDDDGQNRVAVLHERGVQCPHRSVPFEIVGLSICPIPFLSLFILRQVIGDKAELRQHLFGARSIQIEIHQTPAVRQFFRRQRRGLSRKARARASASSFQRDTDPRARHSWPLSGAESNFASPDCTAPLKANG